MSIFEVKEYYYAYETKDFRKLLSDCLNAFAFRSLMEFEIAFTKDPLSLPGPTYQRYIRAFNQGLVGDVNFQLVSPNFGSKIGFHHIVLPSGKIFYFMGGFFNGGGYADVYAVLYLDSILMPMIYFPKLGNNIDINGKALPEGSIHSQIIDYTLIRKELTEKFLVAE